MTFLLVGLTLFGQKKIITPVEGKYGKDYIIVNYVDWGIGDTVKDLNCGTKSYNGHQGTDYTIRNFKQMDSGVFVLACDTGTVTFIQDGLFDKETAGDIAKGLGNYIAIAHSGKFYSYYGHLKKSSLLVKIGDQVLPGQKIAEIGSSGNSTDPHLHFEWWFDSSLLIDPYRGTCGNSYNYFANADPYDTSFQVWKSSLFNDTVSLNILRNEPENKGSFFSGKDSIISYWNLIYGLKKNDKLTLKWFNPSDDLWFEYNLDITSDFWYYYYWSFINTPQIAGNWRVAFYRNNQLKDTKIFMVETSNNLNLKPKNEIKVIKNQSFLQITNALGCDFKVYSISGSLLNSYKINDLNYLINIAELPKNAIVIGQFMLKDEILSTHKISTF